MMNAIIEGRRCLGCGYELAGRESDRCPECGRINEPLQLLATYHEQQLGQQRDFFLYTDRISVHTRKTLSSETEAALRLASLGTDLTVHRARHAYFKNGLVLLFASGGFLAVGVLANLEKSNTLYVTLALAIPMFIISIAMICLTFRRVEFYYFYDAKRPEVARLGIARRGPDADQFEEFISLIRRQIIATHRPPPVQATPQPPTEQPS